MRQLKAVCSQVKNSFLHVYKGMSDTLIKDLKLSLGKLDRLLKAKQTLEEAGAVELKEIHQDIMALTSNIDSFIACLKAKKDPKQIAQLKRRQKIQEQVFRQFAPLMMAYNIMLTHEEP